ncbi:PIN domain-containing protein [Candidatus Gottesmanbacteria bacterium]|nr:PIN domain-containing protein [Candidatus Gottesmanbacteria bacterium]
MEAIVLDTDTLIDYSKGYAPWIDELVQKGSVRLVLPTIVIAEFFASKTLDDPYEVEVADKTFALFSRQDLTEPIAKTLGGLLRHKTYPSGASTADLIIAATALFLGAPLATRNKGHFRSIPDLTFFDPVTIKPA